MSHSPPKSKARTGGRRDAFVWSKKDVAQLRVPMGSAVLMDNSPCCLRMHPENGHLCPNFHPPRHALDAHNAPFFRSFAPYPHLSYIIPRFAWLPLEWEDTFLQQCRPESGSQNFDPFLSLS